jgi:LysR family glycine cleavage system transcriptional activator
MRRLPPLNAVRAYEAVFRHGSLTRASKELHVTHGALSRQVALLEEWVGQPLFIRTPASTLLPTEAGRRYGEQLGVLLDGLATASGEACRADAMSISITAAPTFTLHWLIPRMTSFQRRHPDVALKLSTSAQPAELSDGGSDVVIHSVRVVQERVEAQTFMRDHYIPVCHVDLLEGVSRPEASWLARQALLSYASWPDVWDVWAAAALMSEACCRRGQHFEHMFLTRQAVLEGLGVAILPVAVVLDDIVQGTLAAPYELRGALPRPWLACHFTSNAAKPRIGEFLAWLADEGRAFEATAATLFGEPGGIDGLARGPASSAKPVAVASPPCRTLRSV